jgi:hypothetical protein
MLTCWNELSQRGMLTCCDSLIYEEMIKQLFFIGYLHMMQLLLCFIRCNWLPFSVFLLLVSYFAYCRMYCCVVYMHEERLIMATLILQERCLTWHCYLCKRSLRYIIYSVPCCDFVWITLSYFFVVFFHIATNLYVAEMTLTIRKLN